MLGRTGPSAQHAAVLASPEYAAIAAHYEGQTAARSGVTYLQHIDEGLWVLDQIGASPVARLAYCLHPLCQGDDDLAAFDPSLASTPEVLVAAIEYRNVANRHLSNHHGVESRGPRLSPLLDVNEMLIADKVQNRKDFEDHHAQTHPKTERLAAYFADWLAALGVSEERYETFATALRAQAK